MEVNKSEQSIEQQVEQVEQAIPTNISNTTLIQNIKDNIEKIQELYQANRSKCNIGLSIISVLSVLAGLVNLSAYTNLFFVALVYMSARALGKFYGSIDISSGDTGSSSPLDEINSNNLANLSKTLLELANGWTGYAGLVIFDWVLDGTMELFGGLVLDMVLQCIRIYVYIMYTRLYIGLLEPICANSERELTGKHIISSEKAEQLKIPTGVKYLINVISVNNVFCLNICGKLNLRVLKLTNGFFSGIIDLITNSSAGGLKALGGSLLSSIQVQNLTKIMEFIRNYSKSS